MWQARHERLETWTLQSRGSEAGDRAIETAAVESAREGSKESAGC